MLDFKNYEQKNTSKIFKDIENIRKKNNKNWMDLLRLSYELSPKKTVAKSSKAKTVKKKIKKVSKK